MMYDQRCRVPAGLHEAVGMIPEPTRTTWPRIGMQVLVFRQRDARQGPCS